MTEQQLRLEANNLLRSRGIHNIWHLQKAAKWQTDIFGVFDLEFFEETPRGWETCYVQLTTLSNASKRREKILFWLSKHEMYEFPNAFLWSWDEKIGKFREENIIIRPAPFVDYS